MSKTGGWLQMDALIDDEVLETIAVVGEPHEIAGKLLDRCGSFADRLSLVAVYAPDAGRWLDVVRAIQGAERT
ncbi:MAG: hypothetical protein JRE13_08565 [Deltaproteobacteria bacterium]|nr:hypothetical protein [Deltaproteobacteria bacterium]